MRDIKDYEDKYINEYPFEDKITEKRKKMLVEQCCKYPHRTIVEIGCGMKPFFLDFKDYENMVIAEPGEMFSENAKKLAEKENKNVHVVTGFFEEQNENIKNILGGVKPDIIILSGLLHEVDNPVAMLNAIGDLCGSDTVVHINVPNANSVHRLVALEAGMINDVHDKSDLAKQMQQRDTYDMDSLREEVEAAGFEVEDCGSYFIKPFTHFQMKRCMDEKIIDDRVLDGLAGLIKYMPDLGAEIYVNVKKKK